VLHRRNQVVAVAVATLGALVALVPPAGAAQFAYKTNSFDLPTSGRGVGVVRCPTQTHAYGGGARADAGSQFIVASFPIDSSDPGSKPDDGWKVRVDNLATSDTARVAVVCGKQEPKYKRAAMQVEGDDRDADDVDCPEGRRVTGGGVDFTPAFLQGRIAGTTPVGNGWHVVLDNLEAQSPATIFAVCGKGGFRRVRQPFQAGVFSTGSDFARCGPGQRLVGGGVLTEGAYATSGIGSSFAGDGADRDRKADDVWQGAIDNSTGSEIAGAVTAICKR
jgi:hypothetical protein